MALATPHWKMSICCWMYTAMVWSRGPPRIAGTTKKLRPRMKISKAPLSSDDRMLGRYTRKNVVTDDAPMVRAASIRLLSTADMPA
jgi:hypothetical protein